jgi:predicted DNA-binding transcriptional regulator
MTNKLSPTDKLSIANLITREWLSHLANGEFIVAMAIYDRTIAWGKPWETIRIEELRSGTPNHRCGLNMSKRMVQRHLASLERRGFILRECRKYAWNYSLNIAKDLKEENPMELKLPKDLNNDDLGVTTVPRGGRHP